MRNIQEFRPDWVSAPGDTIADILRERGLSEADLAKRLGLDHDTVSDLLQGRATVTIAIARRLEKVLGSSVEFWMSRDFQYRQDIARLHGGHEEWLAEFPIGDMIKFGWLTPVPHPSDEVGACLRFFNVLSVDEWHQTYDNLQQIAAFRTSPSFDSRTASVVAWLRQGEIQAEAIDCKPWDSRCFEKALSHIRSLTREKNPNRFLPKLQEACSACGVAVAIVRAPSGCRASGATRFLSPEKALVQLSFRYLTDDHFWFTFFHEAGHLLLHSDKCLFLEGAEFTTSTEEEEANEFAERTLIPAEFKSELLELAANADKIIRFSRRLGISPGIVVGQLQHIGKIRRDHFNSLKRRFAW